MIGTKVMIAWFGLKPNRRIVGWVGVFHHHLMEIRCRVEIKEKIVVVYKLLQSREKKEKADWPIAEEDAENHYKFSRAWELLNKLTKYCCFFVLDRPSFILKGVVYILSF